MDRDLLRLIWKRRAWLLIPPIIALVLVGALIFVASSLPTNPMSYPVF